jgi:GNAT superfamily N-acetyltransferase
VNVRVAVLADAPGLAELSGQLGYPTEAADLRARMERLALRKDHVVYVAESADGALAGWIHATTTEMLEVGRRAEIVGLVVDERHRGEGVGKRLVRAAEQWAAGQGHAEITVRSNVTRDGSHPFYRHIGFDHVKTQHQYRKPLSP